jgi:hypothetical protein
MLTKGDFYQYVDASTGDVLDAGYFVKTIKRYGCTHYIFELNGQTIRVNPCHVENGEFF